MQDEQEDQVVAESRLLFEYFVGYVPNVHKLTARKHKLCVQSTTVCVKPEEGIIEQSRGLERLERWMIQSGSFAEDAYQKCVPSGPPTGRSGSLLLQSNDILGMRLVEQ
jgi:hypothetical protein